ncbi:MAG: aldo/keto reductase [Clostridia bacterium]|nr:aldo/keto reductase [Clostridia bacterium]
MNKLFTRRQFLRGSLAAMAGIALSGMFRFPYQAEAQSAQPAFDLDRRVFHLSNGMQMPILGLGTYTLMNRVAESSVLSALENGYRLIDTAAGYGNERGVGQGVQKSGVGRDEIFLTTKLWPTNVAMSDIDHRLELLEMDYIDLLLLHQPDGDYVSAYRTMEEAVRQGKVRALGLSNFTATQIEEILEMAEIPPVLLQVETHLRHQQKLTAQYLKGREIALEGWSPLGGRPNTPIFLTDETVQEIAGACGKTPAQVIIRWHLQSGRICIPGSSSADHIRENIDVFDFSLSEEEMERLNGMDRKEPFFPEMGPRDEDTLAVMQSLSMTD